MLARDWASKFESSCSKLFSKTSSCITQHHTASHSITQHHTASHSRTSSHIIPRLPPAGLSAFPRSHWSWKRDWQTKSVRLVTKPLISIPIFCASAAWLTIPSLTQTPRSLREIPLQAPDATSSWQAILMHFPPKTACHVEIVTRMLQGKQNCKQTSRAAWITWAREKGDR